MYKIALELNDKNVITGTIHIANENYTSVLRDNPNLVIANVEDISDIIPYKTKYENGQLVQLQDYCQAYYDKQQNEELRIQLQQAIQEIEDWFNDYDMQIKQYERDIRLGITGTYHIGNTTYTIAELDATAVTKAAQINTLKAQLNSLGE